MHTMIQTVNHPVLDFLMKYDLAKIVKYLSSDKYMEREVLKMCVIRSKGRPPRITARSDIESVTVPHKILLLNKIFDGFLHKLLSFCTTELSKKDSGTEKYKFLKRKRNIEYTLPQSYKTCDENLNVELLCGELDGHQVQKVISGLPKLKGTLYVSELNHKIQLFLAINLKYIQQTKFFTAVTAIDAEKFKGVNKPRIFNIFFLLSAFITTTADFVSSPLMKSFFFFLLGFLDSSYESFDFLNEFDSSTISSPALCFVQIPDTAIINKTKLDDFCEAWTIFAQDLPAKYRKLCGGADEYGARVLRLIELFKTFAEVFLMLEAFQHRLIQE